MLVKTSRNKINYEFIKSTKENIAISIGVVGNAADFFKYVLDKGIIPDLVTDQTSAHDPLNGYVPNHMTVEEALALRKSDPKKYVEMAISCDYALASTVREATKPGGLHAKATRDPRLDRIRLHTCPEHPNAARYQIECSVPAP